MRPAFLIVIDYLMQGREYTLPNGTTVAISEDNKLITPVWVGEIGKEPEKQYREIPVEFNHFVRWCKHISKDDLTVMCMEIAVAEAL